jgi:hypothetical protein
MNEAFLKFNLNKYYQNYKKDIVLENLVKFIVANNFRVLLAIDDNNVVLGCGIFFIMPQVFDCGIKQIQDLTIQPSPNLSSRKQSEILILLIEKAEKIAKEEYINNVLININPEYDIGKFLIKRGYINSDITYIRKVR